MRSNNNYNPKVQQINHFIKNQSTEISKQHPITNTVLLTNRSSLEKWIMAVSRFSPNFFCCYFHIYAVLLLCWCCFHFIWPYFSQDGKFRKLYYQHSLFFLCASLQGERFLFGQMINCLQLDEWKCVKLRVKCYIFSAMHEHFWDFVVNFPAYLCVGKELAKSGKMNPEYLRKLLSGWFLKFIFANINYVFKQISLSFMIGEPVLELITLEKMFWFIKTWKYWL